jgi:hypothetical protein
MAEDKVYTVEVTHDWLDELLRKLMQLGTDLERMGTDNCLCTLHRLRMNYLCQVAVILSMVARKNQGVTCCDAAAPDLKEMAESLVRNSLIWHRVSGLVTVGYFICEECGRASESMVRDTTLAGKFRAIHTVHCNVGKAARWLQGLKD